MKGRKWKEIRSALVMSLVMVSTLSTATYAWFSLTSSPTVTGLQMTAASTEGLKICETANGDYVDAIAVTSTQAENKKLSPVSLTDSEKAEFYAPVYTGNKVTGLEATALNATDDTGLDGYVAKYTYYLKSDAATEGVGILTGDPSLQTGDMGVTNAQADIPGTFVRKTNDQDTNSAINAVRVGFLVGSDFIIYEPNNEADTNAGTKAVNGIAETDWPESDVISDTNNQITKGYKTATGDYTSEKLFDVTSTGTEVTMYIWLEGTDDDCVDQIKLDEIQAQIQFTIVEDVAP